MKRNLRRTRWAAIAFAVPLTSCLQTDPPKITAPEPTHYARIEGKVTTVSGAPVGNARVGIHVPTNRSPLAYVAPDQQTLNSGDYQLLIARYESVGPLPPADTLTVYVLAVQSLQGGRIDSGKVTLTFVRVDAQSEAHHLDITLGVP